MISQADLRFYRDPVGKYKVDTYHQLGHGAFGTVHSAINEEQVKVAVKKIPFNTAGSNKVYDNEKKACVDMNLIKQTHENVVAIFDLETTSDPNALWVFMEFCNKGDLNKYFLNEPSIIHDLPQKFEIMKQIARGILFLHENGVIHRDIKPDNIMMQSNNGLTCKLTDFGLIKRKLDGDKSSMNTQLGTKHYMAPEFWDTKQDGQVHYHKDVDIFATGLTFLAMIQAKKNKELIPEPEDLNLTEAEENKTIGQIMYLRQGEKKKDLDVVQDKPDEEPTVTKIKTLIGLMTDATPSERLTAKQLVKQLGGMQGYGITIAQGNPNSSESETTDEVSKAEETASIDTSTEAPKVEHIAKQTTEPVSLDNVDAVDGPNVIQENSLDALLNKSFDHLGPAFCNKEITSRIPPHKLDQFGLDVGLDQMQIDTIKANNPVGIPGSAENRNRELINILINKGSIAPVRLAYEAFNKNGLIRAAEKLMAALKS